MSEVFQSDSASLTEVAKSHRRDPASVARMADVIGGEREGSMALTEIDPVMVRSRTDEITKVLTLTSSTSCPWPGIDGMSFDRVMASRRWAGAVRDR